MRVLPAWSERGIKMEYLNDLYDLCEFLNRDLKEMNEKIRNAGGKLTNDMIAYVDKLTHSIKSVKTVIAMIEEKDGYSNAYGDRTGRVHWNDGSVSYDGDMRGNSYARGRGSRAKRDAMGRYSSDSYGGYSRKDAKEDMMTELHELMNEADPSMRGEFQNFINKIERM